MATLYVTRGLPGSGKTTEARAWVAEDFEHRARINRDDLRAQMHASQWRGEATERQVVVVRNAAIRALLYLGIDVVCDDTNLPIAAIGDLRQVATRAGAELVIWDLSHVQLDVCLARNASRDDVARVPDEQVRAMYDRYIAGQPYPLPTSRDGS